MLRITRLFKCSVLLIATLWPNVSFTLPVTSNVNTSIHDLQSSYQVTRHLPHSSPDVAENLRNGHFAGYMPISNGDHFLFFWYIKAYNPSEKLVVWLNGGPGCSSLLGAFTENGPFQMTANGTLEGNPYSWHNQANILYVEQPVGVGFSYSTLGSDPVDHDEDDMKRHFHSFMESFYNVFTETQPYDLYITGESFAGVYIPMIAEELLSTPFSNGNFANLKGLGIGNGVLNDDIQSSFVGALNDVDFLHDSGFFGDDQKALRELGKIGELCRYATKTNYTEIPYKCDIWDFASDWKYNTAGYYPNIYNIDNDEKSTLPIDRALDKYLSDAEVQKSIHVNKRKDSSESKHLKWTACGDTADELNDNVPRTSKVIPYITSKGVHVTLYDGDRDFIVNYMGFERAIGNMTWDGETGFTSPTQGPHDWVATTKSTETPAGLIWERDSVSYIRIYGAGHEVPTYQPKSAVDLLHFILNK